MDTGTATDRPDVSAQARRRAKKLTDLLWHLGTFLIINACFWLLDLGLGQSGLQWAFWITGMWGVALAFHVLAYLIDGRQLEDRKAEQYARESTQH